MHICVYFSYGKTNGQNIYRIFSYIRGIFTRDSDLTSHYIDTFLPDQQMYGQNDFRIDANWFDEF